MVDDFVDNSQEKETENGKDEMQWKRILRKEVL